jgi:uncharacterized protein
MTKLLQPQEIEVYYIIPSLKRELAKCMSARGERQGKIAKLLLVEKATVSQYLSGKRGAEVEFDENFSEEIYKSARQISDKMSFIRETQRLLQIARDNMTVCKVHKKYSDVPEDCSPEKVNCFGTESKTSEKHGGCGCGNSEGGGCGSGGCGTGDCGCSHEGNVTKQEGGCCGSEGGCACANEK